MEVLKSMINENYLQILKDFLDKKITPDDIKEEDKPVIIELGIARQKQLENKINKEIEKLKKKKI